MVRILGFHCHSLGSILGWRTEIPQAVRHGQGKKKKRKFMTGNVYIVVITSKDVGAAGLRGKLRKDKCNLGNSNPLQYSCLESPRDRGAWWAAVCGIAQSRTRLK